MNTLIFRTIAPLLTVVMLVFSVFILLRGHNEPGGGFIGGLIAASALAIYGMAAGPEAARRALKAHPLASPGSACCSPGSRACCRWYSGCRSSPGSGRSFGSGRARSPSRPR
jgi:hypothetical protein